MNRKRFVAALMRHETNTFSPVPTPVSAFGRIGSTDGPARGEEAVRVYRGTNNPLAAFIDFAEREGASLAVPIAANAHPSAPAPDDILDLVSDAILEAVREGCDALFLDLHGAMVTEGFDDGEGELLRRIRAEAPELPIAVALDFHTNLTRDLALLPTVLAGYRTYPHIDMYETGMRAGEALLRAMAGEASATAWHSLPLMPHMNVHSPSRPPMQAIVDRARAAEESGEVLLASVFGCFPLADIEHVGISAVVVGPADRAERLVLDLMGEAWDKRADFLFEIEPMADSLSRAAAMKDGDGPVLLVDHGDNTGSGGNQDVMAALRECLRQGLTDMVAGPFADAQAVAEMIAAGVGAEVEVGIGGKTDMPAMGLRGEPLRLRGRVRRITDGEFTVTGPMFTGVRLSLGRTVVLDTGAAEVVVSEDRYEPFDTGCFTHCGIDPASKRYVLIKSRQHFRAGFEPIAREIVMLAGPGTTTSDYSLFPWKKLRRPIYPLDPDIPSNLPSLKEAAPMTLTMLQHVNIMTDKLDETVAFYEDILGFENGERPNFAFPGAWLYCGEEAVVHLIGVDEQEGSGSGCIDHVAFAAEGFDRYTAFLGEKGYEHETRAVPGGRLRQIFVRDPNEVLIELNFRADE